MTKKDRVSSRKPFPPPALRTRLQAALVDERIIHRFVSIETRREPFRVGTPYVDCSAGFFLGDYFANNYRSPVSMVDNTDGTLAAFQLTRYSHRSPPAEVEVPTGGTEDRLKLIARAVPAQQTKVLLQRIDSLAELHWACAVKLDG